MAGGSALLAKMCSRPNLCVARVETHDVTRLHIHGSDHEAHRIAVDAVEINELFQRFAERGGVIDARCIRGARAKVAKDVVKTIQARRPPSPATDQHDPVSRPSRYRSARR